MAPVFHSIICLFWKWLFYWAHIDLNHMLCTVFLFLVRWNWHVCMCVSVMSVCERNKDKRDLRWKETFPQWESFWIVFRRFICHFLIVRFFFLNHFFSAMNDCVIFIVVVEPQGEHWQFWQDYEARRISWGKYYHVLCKSFLILLSS